MLGHEVGCVNTFSTPWTSTGCVLVADTPNVARLMDRNSMSPKIKSFLEQQLIS
jgi:hypothetical protein